MSLHFLGNNLKWKTLQFSDFLCKLLIWLNSALQVIVQNAITQSDCRVLWSSIFLEWKRGYPPFCVWRYLPRKGSMWHYYFWLGVSRHYQRQLYLPRLTRVPLGIPGGTATIMVIVFWHFLMFDQISLSPQGKQSMIISNKHVICELPHELSNDLRLRILRH